MLKPIKIISSTPFFIFRLFKKTKIDNFVFGLMFGAIFSLVVNVLTVKIQEDLTKQRALEALDREITYHIIEIRSVLDQEKEFSQKPYKEISTYAIDDIMSQRLGTEVWQSREVSRYLLEMDPKVAAEVELYYKVLVSNVNRNLERNQNDFEALFKACRPFYKIIESKEAQTTEYCETIAKNSIQLQAMTIGMFIDNISKVTKSFHPTEDRLHSWWLQLLLGNKSVEILK